MYAASQQLPIYRADNRIQISRLREIVIHLHSDASHCGFNSRVSRQENRYAIGIRLAHGLHYVESVTFPINIDVREQHIKAASFYRGECLRHGGSNLHLKSAFLQNGRKRQTNARLIIDEEKLVAALALLGMKPPFSLFQSLIEFFDDGEKSLGVLLVSSFLRQFL